MSAPGLADVGGCFQCPDAEEKARRGVILQMFGKCDECRIREARQRTPAPKAAELEAAIDDFTGIAFGRTRTDSIKAGRCVTCGGPAETFTDDKSRAEYRISGMCQGCQDVTFSEAPEIMEG